MRTSAYRDCVGALVEELPVVAAGTEPIEPEPVVLPPELRVDEPVVDRVVVLIPTRARTPLSRLITRVRLTPSPTTTARRRRSITVVLLEGAVA